MAKVKIQGHASGTGVLTVTAPNTSTDRTITLPDSTGTLLDNTSTLDATKLSGNLPAISGASLTGITSPNPNLIINGAMQVAQRNSGTVAQANSSNEGYATLDRFALQFGNNAGGTITTSQSTTSPDGFGTSYKLDVTSADTSVGDTELVYVQQVIEAQDMVNSGWDYTDSSSNITLSFWVRNSKTGTYCVAFQNYDGGDRMYTAEYTVSTADTWEKKTVTIPGNSNLSFNLDNGAGLGVYFILASAAGRQSSAGSWTGGQPAYGTSNQVNFLDSTSNVMYLTGVKLEVGDTATDFQHRSYGEELALCQRYYYRHADYAERNGNGPIGLISFWTTTAIDMVVSFPCQMRAAPSIQNFTGSSDWIVYRGSANVHYVNTSGLNLSRNGRQTVHLSATLAQAGTAGQTGQILANTSGTHLSFDAEL